MIIPAHLMNTNFVGAQLVIAGCTKWPELPNLTLARKLYNDNPGVWTTLSAVRLSVQYRRGKIKSKRPKGIIESAKSSLVSPQLRIPPSFAKDFIPYEMKIDKDVRAAVMGDIHLPYHDIRAVETTLKSAKRNKCGIVILNGDTLDFHRLSRFNKEPGSRSVKDEFKAANELLDYIDELFPKARKIWRDGNHEDRYGLYLNAMAPEIFDMVSEKCSIPKLLKLEDRGWEYVSEKRPMYLGGLTLLHGHEYPTPMIGPVNAARGLFLRTQASAMVNHHHQTSEHTAPTVRGKMITTWSLGCLCGLHPTYAVFNKWNHGAAEIDLSPNGDYSVHNFRIVDGKIL